MQLKKRQTYSDRVRKYRAKKDFPFKPRLKKPEIKWGIIYRGQNPQPIDPHIRQRGQRPLFTLENVEWISMSRNRISSGGYGALYQGKIKFKGKKPSEAIIKRIYDWVDDHDYSRKMKEVIKRLNNSSVSHPKMEFLELLNDRYLVMEPFLRTAGEGRLAERLSKFRQNRDDLVLQLDLSSESDYKIFEQVVKETAHLSQAGLRMKPIRSSDARWLRADIFNAIKKANGEQKVYVQDIDTLEPCDNKINAWEMNTSYIKNVLFQREENVLLGNNVQRTFDRVRMEMGF